MKDINYYTTLSQDTEIEISKLDNRDTLAVIKNLVHQILYYGKPLSACMSSKAGKEIRSLNENQALGLIKALCDQCQETLISK